MAFTLYDFDGDKRISEKDLFHPFISFKDDLFTNVYARDLSEMNAYLANKKEITRQHERIIYPKSYNTSMEQTNKEFETLTYKDFALIFEKKYPAIIEDILYTIASYSKQKPIIKKAVEEEPTEENVITIQRKDKDVIQKVEEVMRNKKIAENVIKIFKALSVDSRKGESQTYVTHISLKKNFVNALR